MVFGASVLLCCDLCICDICDVCTIMFGASVVFCSVHICDLCTMCSVFNVSVLSCCVLCWCICTTALCSVHLPCMDAGASEKLVHSFSIKRNLIPSKPHHNQLMCNELADIGSNLLNFLLDCLRIIVDHLETLFRAFFGLFDDPCDMGRS